tara:strand:- start:1483 stop:2745 length:1263 start_codon:yes stop_codon:yes gene_type:complete
MQRDIFFNRSYSNWHSLLVNLAAVFCLLPFVAPLPISTDVQYPVFFICAFIFMIDLISGYLRLSKIDLYFIFISLLSLIYISPFIDTSYVLHRRVGLLCGFFVYYVFTRYAYLVKAKAILFAIYINFVAIIFHVINPSLFSSIAGHITRTIKFAHHGRGFSGLAAEPNFMGAMSIVFILITFLLYKQNKVTRNQAISVMTLSLLAAMVTSSGTASIMGLTLAALVLIFANIRVRSKLLLLISCLLFYELYTLFYSLDSRGLRILVGLLNDPLKLFLDDDSIGFRMVAILLGFESIIQGNVFGHGVGSLPVVAESIASNTYIERLFPRVFYRVGANLSAFSQYTIELGLFFWVLMVLVYYKSVPSSFALIIRFMTLFFLIATFSILFPPLWMLLGFTDTRNKFLYANKAINANFIKKALIK